MQYYTYQLKENRAYRVVIRHLHPTTPESIIKSEIDELGFTVRSVCNMLHPRTKKPLPLFFVDLEPAINNKDIFSIKTLAYTRVAIEEPHKKQEIVQCQNCQGYNHTRSFCTLKPTCVKCAGPHATAQCSKTVDQPPLCVHCRDPHPANYKGCSFYQFLKERRRNVQRQGNRSTHRTTGTSEPTVQSLQPLGDSNTNPPQPSAQQARTHPSPALPPTITHRSAVTHPTTKAPAVTHPTKIPTQRPSTVVTANPANAERQPMLAPRLTYASVAQSLPRSKLPLHSSIPPSFSMDLSALQTTLISLIDELKTLISPLIEILSRFTTLLVPNPRP